MNFFNVFENNVIFLRGSSSTEFGFPVELGASSGDGTQLDILIKPAQGWVHWDPDFTDLSNISHKTLMESGTPIEEVCHLLNKTFGLDIVYCERWELDCMWLHKMFDKAGVKMQFSCRPISDIVDDIALNEFHSRQVQAQLAAGHMAVNREGSGTGKVVQSIATPVCKTAKEHAVGWAEKLKEIYRDYRPDALTA